MKAPMKVAAHISIALEEFENVGGVCVHELAEAVSIILRTEYGEHNYESFINTLTQNLYPYGK